MRRAARRGGSSVFGASFANERIVQVRLSHWWDVLRSSLWFLPAAMTAGSIVLVFAANWIDRNHSDFIRDWIPILYTGGPEGARQILSTVAGSMITVAGVTFSITIVALTLASSQFGPRLLRNFMRDRANQLVLGTFIATFLYCLLVLPTVRGTEESAFVPYLSVSLGVLLTLASLSVFIYFMHHVSTSIQANEVVKVVAEELDHTVERIYPTTIADPVSLDEIREKMSELDDTPSWELEARSSGYLQLIDEDALLSMSETDESVIELFHRPGTFLARGMAVARIWPSSSHSQDRVEQMWDAFVLGASRTTTQDIEFALNQLVEVAVRALSPGINDPFTAIACLDRLTQGLLRLLNREFPSPYRLSEDRELRIITHPTTFEQVCGEAFHQIRHYGATSVTVLLAMLDRIRTLIEKCEMENRLPTLFEHARLVIRAAEHANHPEHDLETLRARFSEIAPFADPSKKVPTITPAR